ncbi:MAG TPA: transposase [Pyrinomonadaceae bacterium]|nr:transposase [Pyrinomonadaceae bacterium]
MGLYQDRHQAELRAAGWHSRGYLPHFDGVAKPQFITLHLGDSIPATVIERWKNELRKVPYEQERILLQRRIEKYLDMGYGSAFLRQPEIATMVQDSLLKYDGSRYQLFAWVVMPNHMHWLMTRAEDLKLEDLLQSFKSYTAHTANKMLGRHGKFWMDEYFDRHIRNEKHFAATVRYIEQNPVKAKLCKKASDWPFSSAYFKAHGWR